MASYALKKAIIDAICSNFYYHRELKHFLVSTGYPPESFDNLQSTLTNKGKYVPVLVEELDKKMPKLLNNICIELAALQGPVDGGDPEIGKRALAELRRQMGLAKISAPAPQPSVGEVDEKRLAEERERQNALDRVKARFYELFRWVGNEQERGRIFERELLVDLFAAYDIPYDPPYRAPAQEIDGKFTFGGRHWLVEARWRKDMENLNALAHFQFKVEDKLDGTLGLFISIDGFQPEAVQKLLQSGKRRVLLLHGGEFIKIVEQQISLPEALDRMVEDASKHGDIMAHFKI